jgi:HAD superfamily hydrolase (TIGR01509 family)
VTPDLVIFDCDGVLVDSEPIINRAHARVLNACGYATAAQTLLERFCGMTDAAMREVIERELGRALPGDYDAQVGRLLEREFRGALRAVDGVDAAIASLSSPICCYRVCVASSSNPLQLRRKLELTGLIDHFGGNLFSAALVARSKPAPDLFLYAAARMGAAPGRCVVVEDSRAGIEAARAAGMMAIGFCGGSHCASDHADRLLGCGAALAIAGMSELLPAIERLAAGP